MQILLATGNEHKLEEVRGILAPEGIGVLSLSDLQLDLPEPEEDAADFIGNARIKARAYAAASGHRCLADDSGLSVDALDGAPGVRSARYAGIGDTRAQRDAANNDKLLEALQEVPPDLRTARFVCCMCLCDPDGTIIAESEGLFEGRITTAPRGRNGFGYDPLLELPDGRTSAQLDPEEKNRLSHRAQATLAMAARLRSV
ncbi:MAG: RdgB/HAM1 family non-canonical purine NTP pyrophosphatase [Phycisphaerales bacterium]|nr:RdgB/HAM1 family non-canonical purine NTP pyrophosphatase [Phycisphaerales bacterium]